ncbi:MAG: aldehyde dehydrogenase family protein [Endomicrobiaceae bacterium]|nr:aldehyde dehydrogenase family protein [Endomicrobiaceae bacterium]
MEKYYLFVDGKDIDTGKYEYFPYSDMAISDFKKTYQTVTDLKKGKKTEDADKYIYARYCIGDNELNKKAIDAAYKASKIMRNVPVSKRKKIIRDIHKNLVANKENIIKLLAIEGHPKKLAQWEYECMDYALCKSNSDMFKDNIFKQAGNIENETVYLVRKPDGVVVLVPPKNASASNSISAAYCFLAGNSVIVKAPLKAPVATIFVWKNIIGKALKDNNAPDGVMNIITGNSKTIMDEWIENPKVNDIFFFGESQNGLEISKRAHNNNKKTILELSGNDNMFVWRDCDVEGAANSALDAFLGSTQICMLPKNIIVHEKIYEEFKEKFLEKISGLEFGLPSNENTYFTPVVKMKQCQDFLDDALSKGAKLLCGGNRADYNGTVNDKGIYFQPTVIEIETDNPEIFNMKIIKEENFFPVIPLIKVNKKKKSVTDKEIFGKMLDIANKNEYGLRASAWVKSSFYTKQFIKHIDNCALLRINSRHIDFSLYLPAQGGVGKTGGPYGEASYLIQKITHLQGVSLKK